MNKLQGLISSVAAAALAPLAMPSVAHAQSAVDALTNDEEIVVTARKRGDENVQDVPLAVTAFGAAQLEALNFQDLQSLSYTMPNVQMDDVGTLPGYANFSIRGLGINSSIPSIDPAVGIFVDGVYQGIQAGMVFDNFDLEGIEVLRGPQGVLFGRNVTGGAVLVRTTTPSDEFEFRSRAGYEVGESGSAWQADAMVTGPLAEGLSGKLAFYTVSDEGWFENVDGRDVGEREQTILRPALRWSPNDDLDFVLRLEHGELSGDGAISQNHAINSRDSYDITINEPGFQEDSWDSATLETNIRVGFGDGTITNIVGWRQYESDSLGDIDGTTNTSFHASAFFEQEQISEELRYAGTFGNWDVTAGVYYFQQDIFYMEHRNTNVLFPNNGTGGGRGDFSTLGAFVATDWHLSPQFTINLGVRYTEEEKDAQVRTYAVADQSRADYNARLLRPDFIDSQSWNDTSPRIGFQWTPSEDTQIYGFWAQGFRSGGYNFRQVSALSPTVRPGPFDAEEQSSFELGWKQDFADGRGRVNAAIFSNEIQNIQREINNASTLFGVNQQIVNAGDATIQGVELEARWAFTDDLLISLNVGYTDGEYDSVLFDLDGNGLINSADANLEIPRLAPWTYGVTLVHDLTLGDWGGLASRLSYSHRDKNYYTDNNVGFFNEVDILDANFTISPNDGPWSISLYGTNLTDETLYGGDTILPDFPALGGDGNAANQPPTFSPLARGRVIGASLRVNF